MNQLQNETSPYLLQHKNNPVHWQPWSEAVFVQAAQADKPILVSIGYATCHWCHVMEHESFENEAIAALMNTHFVCVKVDREEHPEVDQIYMQALLILEGQGGWPLNMFLTATGQPFLGGTYFPPRSAYGKPAWGQILSHAAHIWDTRRAEVEQQAQKLTALISKSDLRLRDTKLALPFETPLATLQTLSAYTQRYSDLFDTQNGGFGNAPKFPGTLCLHYLIDYQHYTKDDAAMQHVLFSLRQMAQGGIYDVLGGGFSRYTVDAAWLVPHFEKMLYDNALLLSVFAEAIKYDSTPLFEQTIRETVAFVFRELQAPDGGFYSAIDADSEGVEGKFYVWSLAEIQLLLSEPDAALCCAAFDVTSEGNWEAHNILWRHIETEKLAAAFKLDAAETKMRLQQIRQTLFQARTKRIRPITDTKQILGWNALFITALAQCGLALADVAMLEAMETHLDAILYKFRKAETLDFYHTVTQNEGKLDALAEDLAFLAEALVWAYKATQATRYLEEAVVVTEKLLADFSDEEQVFCYAAKANAKTLILRLTELSDNATPSSNSTLCLVLMDLAILAHRPDFQTRAEAMLRQISKAVAENPYSRGRWARAMLRHVFAPAEVAIVGPDAQAWTSLLWQKPSPNLLLESGLVENSIQNLMKNKPLTDSTQVYVCQQQVCHAPVKTLAEALELMHTPAT